MRGRVAKEKWSKGAASGMVALVFLILGFQLAVFVLKVVEMPGQAGHDEFTQAGGGVMAVEESCDQDDSGSVMSGMTGQREPEKPVSEPARGPKRSKYGGYGRPAEEARRTVESFPFDPNTVTRGDLQRLGLSARQAESIENYRSKGGRFRSKADFQKMYVVSDTLFARLEPYIDIPKLELNGADSAALVSLRGIGPYYAHKILDYRDRLGGFWRKEQLLEVEGFDADRYAGCADDVTVDDRKIRKIDLWHASDTLLARHPYLGPRGARSIVRYRELYDSTRWSLPDLAAERVLSQEIIEKLEKYIVFQ